MKKSKIKLKLLTKWKIGIYKLRKHKNGFVISISEYTPLLKKISYEETLPFTSDYKHALKSFDLLWKNKAFACHLNDIVNDICVENMKNK